MAQEVRIRGLDLLAKELKKLGPKMEKSVWRSSVRAGASEFRKLIRRNAPKGRGHIRIRATRKKATISRRHLRDSIQVSTVRSRPGYVRMRVLTHDPKAHLLEFGVKPHIIEARKIRRVMGRNETGGIGILVLPNGRIVPRVKHPGHKAFPFFRPSFDQGYQAAIRKIAQKAEQLIRKLRIKTK